MRGFEQSGIFYSAVKDENKKLGALICGFFGGSIVLCTIALQPLGFTGRTTVFKAVMLAFVIAAVGCFVFRRMNAVLRGNAAHYSCDDVKFCVSADGVTTTLYYAAIVDITFAERTFMRLKRGYDVTVFTDERSYRFTIVFNGFNNLPAPKDTPFEPIIRRVNGLGANSASSLPSPEAPRPAPDMSALKTPAPHSAPTLSTDEMPTVGGASLEGVLSRLNNELNPAEEAPAPPPPPLPAPERERIEAEENPVLTTGSFFCESRVTWALRIIAVAAGVVGGIFVLQALGLIGSYSKMDYAVALIALIFWAALWITLFRFGSAGKKYSYRLRKTEMLITAKNNEICLYTRDLVRIEHRPMKVLLKQYGWAITVITRYKEYKFRVLFPYKRKIYPYEKTALAQLEEYCPIQSAVKENL